MSQPELPIVPIGVKDAPFTLDLMAGQCPPLQFLREFTVNGIEAIEAYRLEMDPDFRGEVVWTINRHLYDLTEGEQVKLCCIDTGIGMGAEELPMYLNDLAASGKTRGLHDNYGIGAKVSAAVGNPEGVLYCSWKDGQGSMVELGRDRQGTWGMRQRRLADGSVVTVVPISDDLKPDELRDLDHGTMVTFLGTSWDHDTTRPPGSVENRDKWIAKTLNQRFYRLPDWVEIKSRQEKPDGAPFMRAVRGQQGFLDQHTIARGATDIPGARVHWRILDDDLKRRKQGNLWASTGHRAALWRDELYELASAARGGYQRLQEFGINVGYERVVLYLEPLAEGQLVGVDPTRSRLLVDREPLPWDRYAQDFEKHMPAELRAFIEQIAAAGAGRDHSKTIRDRLAAISELFQVPRYKPAPAGPTELDEPNAGGRPRERREAREAKPSTSGGSGGRAGNVYALFERQGGEKGTEIEAKALPEIDVDWVSAENGKRTPPHLEDRAARYDRRHNRLEVNADFRGYTGMVERWMKRYRGKPAAKAVIEETVAQWYEQALVETVLGVLALRGSEFWTEREIGDALSETALSAAVMQRYHLDITIKRELAQRLGPLKSAA